MDVITLIYILLIWTIAGLIAAILFGRAIRRLDEDEEAL